MNLGELLENMLNNKTITMDLDVAVNIRTDAYMLTSVVTKKVGHRDYLIFCSSNSSYNDANQEREITIQPSDNGFVTVKLTREEAQLMAEDYNEEIEDDNGSDRYQNMAYKTVRQIRTQLGIALDEYEDEER